MDDYKVITVEDIISFVKSNKKLFPKGLKTPIYSGDFECNYTHGQHSIQFMKKDNVVPENVVCLGYEMHESVYDR